MIDYREDNKWTVYVHIVPKEISGYEWDKYYVGITSIGVKARWGSDGNMYKKQGFYNAIQKYGWDNIQHEIIADNLTLEEASMLEIRLIKELDSYGDHGYNNNLGGRYEFHQSEDLTGQTFGDLTIIKKTRNHYLKYNRICSDYLCKCSCGEIITLDDHQLKHTKVHLCCDKCKRKEMRQQAIDNYIVKNTYKIDDSVLYIYTKANEEIICDAKDFDKIKDYTIKVDYSSRPRARAFKPNNLEEERKSLAFYKLLYKNTDNQILFKNENPLDYREDNLYFVNQETFTKYKHLTNNKDNNTYLISQINRPNFTSYSIDSKLCTTLKNIGVKVKITHHNLEDAIKERNRLLHIKYKDNAPIKELLERFYIY